MAKAATRKPETDGDLEALRTRVAAILESNGFSGTKTANEVVAAVGEHLGADLSAPAEKEKEADLD